MLIVQVNDKQPIDRALKILKSKVIRTKQNEILKKRKNYTKKSVKRRDEILKAKYKNSIKDSH